MINKLASEPQIHMTYFSLFSFLKKKAIIFPTCQNPSLVIISEFQTHSKTEVDNFTKVMEFYPQTQNESKHTKKKIQQKINPTSQPTYHQNNQIKNLKTPKIPVFQRQDFGFQSLQVHFLSVFLCIFFFLQ